MEAAALGLILAALAGASIPLGAALAHLEDRLPGRLHDTVQHTVAAFGGGALFSAIALVLLPEAQTRLPAPWLMAAFLSGGVVFHLVDRVLDRHGGGAAQFTAMLLDYVPEAMALGALIVSRPDAAILTAILIAAQNVPEGFAAWRGLIASNEHSRKRLILLFLLMVPVGPAAAAAGQFWLAALPGVLGAIMAFAAGGILYLLFQDVAPGARMKGAGLPSLGAVAGFGLGLAGHMALRG